MAELVAEVAGVATLGVVQPGWSVSEAATQSDPSGQPPTAPSVSLAALNTSKSKYLSGSVVTLQHDALGSIPGSLGNVVQPSGNSDLSFVSVHSLLLAERVAPPVGAQALSVTYSQYIELVTDQITVDYQATADPAVTYIGWKGSVWQRLHELAVANQQELYVVGATVVVRDQGSYALDAAMDLTSLLSNVSVQRNARGSGQKVNVAYYDPTLVSTIGSVLYNFSQNPSVETNATGWGALTGGVAAPTNTGRKTTDGMFGTCHYGARFSDGSTTSPDPLGPYLWLATFNGYIYNEVDASAFVVGQKYTGSAFAKAAATLTANPSGYLPSGLTASARLQWYNAGGTLIQTDLGTSTSLSSVFDISNRVSASGIKPSGATKVRVTLSFSAIYRKTQGAFTPTPTPPTGYVDAGMDAAMVSPGELVDYGDGSVAGWTWLGTTNNSVSTLPYDDANDFYNALADGNSIYSVEVNATKKFVLTTNNHPTQLIQPIPAIAPPAYSIGEYIVSGSDGLPIAGPQWIDYGGQVIVAIGEQPGTIDLTLVGAREIPGVSGPYSLSVSDGDNEFAALSIAGTGVVASPNSVDLLTGADPEQVSAEFATAVDIPFLNTLENAYDVGGWATVRAGGPTIVLTGTLPTALFESFGIGDGATFIYDECRYRILTTSTGRVSTGITAEWYVTQDDFDDLWAGQTLDDIDVVWEDYTANQLEIAPLRRV